MFPVEEPPPPDTVIVLVAPVPLAVTPDPTKFKVVAAVDKDEPSSCTVRELPAEASTYALTDCCDGTLVALSLAMLSSSNNAFVILASALALVK